MAQNQWVIDLESKVLSLVKGKTYNKLKKRYPQIMYTTSNISNDSQRNFPCVYVHELGGSEANSDLERTRINTIVADMKFVCYFLIDKSFGDKYQYFYFPDRQFMFCFFYMHCFIYCLFSCLMSILA